MIPNFIHEYMLTFKSEHLGKQSPAMGRVGLRVPPLIRIYSEMTVKLTVNDRVILVLRLAYALVW